MSNSAHLNTMLDAALRFLPPYCFSTVSAVGLTSYVSSQYCAYSSKSHGYGSNKSSSPPFVQNGITISVHAYLANSMDFARELCESRSVVKKTKKNPLNFRTRNEKKKLILPPFKRSHLIIPSGHHSVRVRGRNVQTLSRSGIIKINAQSAKHRYQQSLVVFLVIRHRLAHFLRILYRVYVLYVSN